MPSFDGAEDIPCRIVPRNSRRVGKLVDDDDMKIALSVSETKVRFATPDITLRRRDDGTFSINTALFAAVTPPA